MTSFSPFFSEADYKDLEKLIVKPLYADGQTISLIVLTGLSDQKVQALDLLFSKEAGELVQAGQSLLRLINTETVNSKEFLQREVQEDRATGDKAVHCLFEISPARVQSDILSENKLINREWLQEGLLHVVGHVFSGLGRLYSNGEAVYLLISNSETKDVQLLVHQASVSLSQFFKCTNSTLRLQIEEKNLEDI
jgi:hypothetical protein